MEMCIFALVFRYCLMKILILNGSPRPQGNIAQMLDAMKSEAMSLGHEVTMMRVSDMAVKPCMGCMACRVRRRCVLPDDDAQRVLTALNDADVLVIGAPCYWGNLPGQMKVLFDRMVYGLMADKESGLPLPLHKGKRAVVVATSTVSFPFNILMNQTRGVVRAVKEILRYSGIRVVATVQKGGTKKHPLLSKKELKKCRNVMRKLR